ncbi:MAG TPA: trehalase family glycosidase [Bacteroidota bacterium]
MTRLAATIAAILLCLPLYAQEVKYPVRVHATLTALERDEDTDGDQRITIHDPWIKGTERGDHRFLTTAVDGRAFAVAGTYYLSNLLQELKLAEDAGRDTALLDPARIFEPPVDRISRSIAELYWDGLTRRIDEQGLLHIVADEKSRSADGYRYLYVPADDERAWAYFNAVSARHLDWKIRVVRLPAHVTADFARSLDGRHGLLSLALTVNQKGDTIGVPFVVPGGRFNEMYGWDSYFITLGLLRDGRRELAKDMVDNFVYEIDHYGAILNANRTYYLTRSQPPFLTSMALAVYNDFPPGQEGKDQWLAVAMRAAVTEYTSVWTNPQRLTRTGLSRYYDFGRGMPPEVEPGHYDPVLAPYARKHHMTIRQFERAYRAGRVHEAEVDSFFVHDRAMRESGHDTSYRLLGRTADLVTVDLNALLYKIETDLAQTIERVFGGKLPMGNGTTELAQSWRDRAKHRKDLIDRYLWDPDRGLYFDYDFVQGKRTDYVSATTLYPLWAQAASKEQASLLVARALPQLEMPGGIVSSTEASRGPLSPSRPPRQWDYPYGWAPHQVLTWRGLMNSGYDDRARRLAYRWLYTITRNAVDFNGTVPEKFDVVRRTHDVFAEYGNVGTKFSYITREGFGWTNTSYQLGRSLLPEPLRARLNALIPPEWIASW